MNQWHDSKEEHDWKDTTAATGPAVLGVAAGILIGNMVHRGARGPLALSLLCVGAALVTPSTVQAVVEKINSPSTRRGSQRTLQKIREGAGAPAQEIDFVEEEVEMFI